MEKILSGANLREVKIVEKSELPIIKPAKPKEEKIEKDKLKNNLVLPKSKISSPFKKI